MKTLLERLDDYLAHAESLLQSPVHRRVFRFNILRTLRWLEDTHGVVRAEQLTPTHLDGWVRHVTTRRTRKGLPLKITSVAKQIQTDRVFVMWLEKIGAAPVGLHAVFPRLKIPFLLPVSVLEHDTMARLLDRIERHTPAGHRHRAMLEVMYSSGVRVAELLGMDIDSVDLRNGLVRVKGKGSKERIVPIGVTARRLLESYLKGIRPLLQHQPGQTALWLNRSGERMPYHTFRRDLQQSLDEADIKTPVTAHTFRRSCATELIRSGANLWHVKDLLGHENVETLNHYVRLTITDLKKTHHRCHPRERDHGACSPVQ